MAQGFFGRYACPLDEKFRAVLPARLRESVAADRLREGVVLTQGFEGCLMMFLRDDWRSLTERMEKLPFTNRRARFFKRFFLSSAQETVIDKIGRLMVADSLREVSGIQREAVFIGMQDHIEIWEPSRWKKFFADNLNQYEEGAEEVASSLFGAVGPVGPAPAVEERG